jgi:hypothetical protein
VLDGDTGWYHLFSQESLDFLEPAGPPGIVSFYQRYSRKSPPKKLKPRLFIGAILIRHLELFVENYL